MKHRKQTQWAQPWLVRKLAYAAVSLALLIAVGAGLIDADAADQWLGQADKVIGALAMLALGVASAKTHSGSDSRATDEDLVAREKLIDIVRAAAGAAATPSGAVNTVEVGAGLSAEQYLAR